MLAGPCAFYFAFMECSAWQATLGKRLFRIYVTDNNFQRIGTGLAAWRSIAKTILSTWLAPLQLISVLATERRKAIHDFTANTVVLAGRTDGKLEFWRIPVAFVLSVVWMVVGYVLVFRV